jgi:hypothetical protein
VVCLCIVVVVYCVMFMCCGGFVLRNVYILWWFCIVFYLCIVVILYCVTFMYCGRFV